MTKSMLPRLLVLLSLLALSFPASGAVFKSDKNLKIPAEETIKDDLYAVGETITIEGWPARDGSNYMRLRAATRANGEAVGTQPTPLKE